MAINSSFSVLLMMTYTLTATVATIDLLHIVDLGLLEDVFSLQGQHNTFIVLLIVVFAGILPLVHDAALLQVNIVVLLRAD